VKSPASQLGVKQHRVTLDLAEKLTAAMNARGIKASHLAEKLGKSRAWISKFLHGGRNTTFFTAVEIADALGLDVEVRFVERNAAKTPIVKPAESDVAARLPPIKPLHEAKFYLKPVSVGSLAKYSPEDQPANDNTYRNGLLARSTSFSMPRGMHVVMLDEVPAEEPVAA
jgi:transcriptional regulator with XRE-family HTH domain